MLKKILVFDSEDFGKSQKKVIDLFRKASNHRNDSDILVRVGEYYMRSYDYQKAVQLYSMAKRSASTKEQKYHSYCSSAELVILK